MDPRENLDKTIEEITAEEVVASTPKEEVVAAKDEVVFADKPKKKGKGMVIGMVFLALLAAGGIGFGVWAYLTKNQESETLNNQITTLKDQNSDLLDKLGEEGDETTIIDIDADPDSDVDTADYIYIGEWGIKIKIPGNFSYLSYKFVSMADGNGEALYIGAVEGDTQNAPSFANTTLNDNNWLVAVGRYPSDYNTFASGPREPDYSVDGYNYFADSGQALNSSNNADASLETQTVTSLMKILKNKENYSKI